MLQSPTLTNKNISSFNLERNKNSTSSSRSLLKNPSLSSNQSFKGAPPSGFWAGVFGKKGVQKALAWVNDNKAMTDTISMCVVGMTIKPLWILSKKKTKKDDKCNRKIFSQSYRAAEAAVSRPVRPLCRLEL